MVGNKTRVPLSQLNDVVLRGLKRLGYPDDEAQLACNVLLFAQLRGNNQGIVKLSGGHALDRHPQVKPIRVVKQTEVSALLDSGNTNGFSVMNHAAELAASFAKTRGVGIVGTYNSSSTTGALGYYADKLAQQGLVALVFAGSSPTVTYHGAIDPIFGTNPIAFGLPTEPGQDAVVFDMATSAIALYGIIEANNTGKSIPNDVAIDKDGVATSNPAAALTGAILSFDRTYKGSGLGLVVEVLTGALVGAVSGGIGDVNNWGNLVIAINPNILAGEDVTRSGVSKLVAKLKTLRKQPGIKELIVPGERGNKQMRQVLKQGYLEVDTKMWNDILTNTSRPPVNSKL